MRPNSIMDSRCLSGEELSGGRNCFRCFAEFVVGGSGFGGLDKMSVTDFFPQQERASCSVIAPMSTRERVSPSD